MAFEARLEAPLHRVVTEFPDVGVIMIRSSLRRREVRMLDYGSADGMRWLSGQNVAEFIVLDDGRPIICRVSQECLEDNCGCPPAPATLLGAAKDNFNHITDRIGKLISLGRFEADGTILLESSDW
jgi:hypothetical protein